MRIVFFGTPGFAVRSLERLVLEADFEVVAVVTAVDKPSGRGMKMRASEVKQYAEAQGIRVLQPVSLRDPEFLDELRALKADLGIVIAFRMLPQAVWSMPRLGTFNLHASLLPQYRGAAPINWAIMNGETTTGVTTFMLDNQIDTGAILGRVAVPIEARDNAGTLHDKLREIGAKLVVDTVRNLVSGEVKPMPQVVDNEKLKPAPKIFRDDCRIDWSWSGSKIVNHIRGLAPHPGAFYEDANELSIKVFSAVFHASDPRAGLTEKCADGWIELLEIQPAGKRKMTAREYLNGLRG